MLKFNISKVGDEFPNIMFTSIREIKQLSSFQKRNIIYPEIAINYNREIITGLNYTTGDALIKYNCYDEGSTDIYLTIMFKLKKYNCK